MKSHKIYQGDCLEILRTLGSGSIDLTVSSPPYNIGKEYERHQDLDEYAAFQRQVIEELFRVTSDRGSVCWQVGNYVHDGAILPLDYLFFDLFKSTGMQLRNRIIWRFEHGLHASRRFSGRYEVLLWFTKTGDYTFNLDPVRVPSKYPGKRHYKGPNKGKPSGNPLGKNPGDCWSFLADEWESGVWDIPNVKSNHVEKTAHPCQFPVELVERCVLALTNPGDAVLDPFAGAGSTLIAARMHDRAATGIELESNYVQIAEDRLKGLAEGTLRIRLIGKPVHQPTGRLTEMPPEWGQPSEECKDAGHLLEEIQ